MEESISRESGAQFGEKLSPEQMRQLIREIGRRPVERSTSYEILRRFDDPALDPPCPESGRSRPAVPRRADPDRDTAAKLSAAR